MRQLDAINNKDYTKRPPITKSACGRHATADRPARSSITAAHAGQSEKITKHKQVILITIIIIIIVVLATDAVGAA